MSKIINTLEEWKEREPSKIGCVVVGKEEIDNLIKHILGLEEKKEKEKCVMCGNKQVVFEVGSGNKAILNETDYTKMVEAHYNKGDKLCEECLFK